MPQRYMCPNFNRYYRMVAALYIGNLRSDLGTLLFLVVNPLTPEKYFWYRIISLELDFDNFLMRLFCVFIYNLVYFASSCCWIHHILIIQRIVVWDFVLDFKCICNNLIYCPTGILRLFGTQSLYFDSPLHIDSVTSNMASPWNMLERMAPTKLGGRFWNLDIADQSLQMASNLTDTRQAFFDFWRL